MVLVMVLCGRVFCLGFGCEVCGFVIYMLCLVWGVSLFVMMICRTCCVGLVLNRE